MPKKAYAVDTALAVIGELARELQNRYGDEPLSLFHPILREYGFHAGERLRETMEERTFPDRVEAWMAPLIRKGLAGVVEKGPGHIRIRGTNCPLNLEGTNRVLCEACMGIDEGVAAALAGRDVTLTIEKSLAWGDDCCQVFYGF